MKPAAFAYLRAGTVEEAVSLLNRHGSGARILAGGQSLVPMMNFRLARPDVLIDLNGCAGLGGIAVDEDALSLGAMARQRTVEQHPLVHRWAPLVRACLADAGPVTVRNRGTVGGMAANCYPTSDLVTALVCLDARIVVQGAQGRRSWQARDFFLGAFTTALAFDEVVVELRIPRLAGWRHAYLKWADHAAGAAVVGVALSALLDGAGPAAVRAMNVAVSGLDSSVPIRLSCPEGAASYAGRPGAVAELLRTEVSQRGSRPPDAEAMIRIGIAGTLAERALQSVLDPVGAGA
ncbi:MAG: xanthine dehydrogenase family protein subunit M [Lautropia sp.]